MSGSRRSGRARGCPEAPRVSGYSGVVSVEVWDPRTGRPVKLTPSGARKLTGGVAPVVVVVRDECGEIRRVAEVVGIQAGTLVPVPDEPIRDLVSAVGVFRDLVTRWDKDPRSVPMRRLQLAACRMWEHLDPDGDTIFRSLLGDLVDPIRRLARSHFTRSLQSTHFGGEASAAMLSAVISAGSDLRCFEVINPLARAWTRFRSGPGGQPDFGAATFFWDALFLLTIPQTTLVAVTTHELMHWYLRAFNSMDLRGYVAPGTPDGMVEKARIVALEVHINHAVGTGLGVSADRWVDARGEPVSVVDPAVVYRDVVSAGVQVPELEFYTRFPTTVAALVEQFRKQADAFQQALKQSCETAHRHTNNQGQPGQPGQQGAQQQSGQSGQQGGQQSGQQQSGQPGQQGAQQQSGQSGQQGGQQQSGQQGGRQQGGAGDQGGDRRNDRDGTGGDGDEDRNPDGAGGGAGGDGDEDRNPDGEGDGADGDSGGGGGDGGDGDGEDGDSEVPVRSQEEWQDLPQVSWADVRDGMTAVVNKSRGAGQGGGGPVQAVATVDPSEGDPAWMELVRHLRATSIHRQSYWEELRMYRRPGIDRYVTIPGRLNIVEDAIDMRVEGAVYLDMSGSITPEERDLFVKLITEDPTIKVHWHMFTTEIYPFEPPAFPVVSGGTDFTPILRHVETWEEHHPGSRVRRPDFVIVVTDGYAPEIVPPDPERWVWLMTSPRSEWWPERHGMTTYGLDEILSEL